MTGIMEFAGIWKKREQVYGTSAYYAFQMYVGANIARSVETTVHSGEYFVEKGVRDVAHIANVAYLDVVAARWSGYLSELRIAQYWSLPRTSGDMQLFGFSH